MTPALVNPPVRLGVLTDIQYADKPDYSLPHFDQKHFDETSKPTPVPERFRCYSRVLEKTRLAVDKLNQENVSATIHLGDIVDGNDTLDSTKAELQHVLSTLSAHRAPLFHVIGNHCLAAGRAHLLSALQLDSAFYIHDVSPRWRLVVLDTVDVSIEREKGHPYRLLAERHLDENPQAVNSMPWNGAVGPHQLEWLKDVIVDAQQNGKFIIVCGHHPILEEAAHPMHLLWNAVTLKQLFKEYNSVIKAYFAGHFHDGGYAMLDGVHHITFEAVLDSQTEHGSWGVVELHDDRIAVQGHGEMTSRDLMVL